MIRIVTMNGEVKFLGDVGPRGPKGEQGEQGPIGPVGPQGPAGGDYDDTELRNLIANKVDKEAGKGLFSGNYNDLSNKPTIPTKTSELINDSSYVTETYVTNAIENAQIGGGSSDIDLSGYATKDDLNNKVDKVTGKSLIADTEIERLKNVTNYDDTEIRNTLNSKANSSDIPIKTSQLTNDSGFIKEVPSEYITETELNAKGYLTEHQDISNLATKTELNNKQDKLVAGDNITITGNTISATGGSGGTTDYMPLSNKPKINGVELTGDKTSEELGLATKTSQLINDSGFKPITYSDTDLEAGVSVLNTGTIHFIYE